MNDDFYIGWQDRAPREIGRCIRLTVAILASFSVLLAAVVGAAQRTIGNSFFEWGTLKQFTGVLVQEPYPHLLVERPGRKRAANSHSAYLLVNPFKFGFDAETAKKHDGRKVMLKGTLIYRDGQTMIEVVPESVQSVSRNDKGISLERVNLGRQTLRGEIVDSKCYLGVMNPGEFIPHRACAIRCIIGGIPPILVVRRGNAPALHLLLVSTNGLPLNKEVIPFIAEPVEITGEVRREGEMLILSVDPATFRRL